MRTALVMILLVTSALAQNSNVIPHAPACGAANVQFSIKMDSSQTPAPEVEAGKALIYVVEDQKFKAVKDVTARVGLDGAWVGATRGDSFLFFSVEPGEHHLCADWVSSFLTYGRNVALFGFTAEAGKTYYFRARTMGGPPSMTDRNGLGDSASIDLDLVNSDEGRLLVESSTLSVSHPKK
jgi:hypothetical protein